MGHYDDILAHARNNPKGVRFQDACALAEHYGFTKRVGGKHPHLYKRKGMLRMLNFQPEKDGKAKEYQVRQLLLAVEEIEALTAEKKDKQ